MIKYELAKELKDAGYPPPEEPKTGHYDSWIIMETDGYAYYENTQDKIKLYSGTSYNRSLIYIPTLSELIEACNQLCGDLAIFSDGYGWRCGDYMPYEHDWLVRIENKDLDTAMALLWLELNKVTKNKA